MSVRKEFLSTFEQNRNEKLGSGEICELSQKFLFSCLPFFAMAQGVSVTVRGETEVLLLPIGQQLESVMKLQILKVSRDY